MIWGFLDVENYICVSQPKTQQKVMLVHQIMPSIQGHIRFEQVTFHYLESNTNTLENISFEVQPRQTVALVGHSGSGKTTISKLLLGLYPPTVGRISMGASQFCNKY